jgi:hypothetical protein
LDDHEVNVAAGGSARIGAASRSLQVRRHEKGQPVQKLGVVDGRTGQSCAQGSVDAGYLLFIV